MQMDDKCASDQNWKPTLIVFRQVCVRVRVISRAVKMHSTVIWFLLVKNSQIILQSVQQKHSPVCSDWRNRKQKCMQPGNGLPSERTGGPVKDEMTVICLGRRQKDVHFSKCDQIIPEFSSFRRELRSCMSITYVQMSKNLVTSQLCHFLTK